MGFVESEFLLLEKVFSLPEKVCFYFLQSWLFFNLGLKVGYDLAIYEQWKKAYGEKYLQLPPRENKPRKKRRKQNRSKKKKIIPKKKPEWVKEMIFFLKAKMPNFGCRKIADTFNRLFERSEKITVGKTFVNRLIRKYPHEIEELQEKEGLQRNFENIKLTDFGSKKTLKPEPSEFSIKSEKKIISENEEKKEVKENQDTEIEPTLEEEENEDPFLMLLLQYFLFGVIAGFSQAEAEQAFRQQTEETPPLTTDKSKFGRKKEKGFGGKKKRKSRKKPRWVREKVLYLKALSPKDGCRKIARTFNLRYGSKGKTVGKSYVRSVLRDYFYEIEVLLSKQKNKKPYSIGKNVAWGIDLTGKTDSKGKMYYIFGIIEYHSRKILCLEPVESKDSFTLLKLISQAIQKYGKPKRISTDNESVFISRFFRKTLSRKFGVKQQIIEKGKPWQNGRIERFWGTLKERLNKLEVDSFEQLKNSLKQFDFWYNNVRPHQNLDGKTPSEVWNGKNVFTNGYKKAEWFEAWDGLLTGYFLTG